MQSPEMSRTNVRTLSDVIALTLGSSVVMIENYLSRPDEELEDTAADRTAVRNATFSIEERPSGTFCAAFTVPSSIEEGDIILLGAEGPDRHHALVALLWMDDQTPQGFGYAI
jgi:hypothetical protein